MQNGDIQKRRRFVLWLVLAAGAIVLVVSVVAVVGSRDDATDRTDENITTTTLPANEATQSSTTAAPTTSSVPTTTSVATTIAPSPPPVGWTGGLLDDIDSATLRPLSSYVDGDVIVPTGPNGWRVFDSGVGSLGDSAPERSRFMIFESSAVPDEGPQDPFTRPRIFLTLTTEDVPCAGRTLNCLPSSDPATIDGIGWLSFADEPHPDVVSTAYLRGNVGDMWIQVTTGGGFADPLLEEPTIIEFVQGLRVGSPDDLAAAGVACWGCGPGAPPDAIDLDGDADADLFRLGAFDTGSLRPLSSLSPTDVVVPTGPADWYLPTTINAIDDNGELQMQSFWAWTDSSGNRSLGVFSAPTCAPDATSCPMSDSGFKIDWPVTEEIVVGDLTWGYPGGDQRWWAATVVGDRVVAVTGLDYSSSTPLLDDADTLTLLEGLRIMSLADLPAEFDVIDEFGRSIETSAGSTPKPRVKQAVAAADVRGTTLILNADSVDGEKFCLTLDREDNGQTVWASGCFAPGAVDETLVLDVAQLATGPGFDQMGPDDEFEYLLIGYVDVPTAAGVRASVGGVSVEGRTADPVDGVDGVFVLMSVNDLDAVIDFEGGFNTATIQLDAIEP